MSVINNVLKDLDGRPSQFTPIKRPAEEGCDESKNRTRSGWLLLALITGLAIVLAAILFQQEDVEISRQPDMPAMEKPLVVQDQEAVSRPVVRAVIQSPIKEAEQKETPVAVTGLQINETAEYIDLSLQLEPEAQAFLKQRARNRYRFLISNTHKTIIAPSIEDSVWLRNIDISRQPAGFELTFDTANGVLVESRGQIQGDRYQWLVRLKKQTPPEVAGSRVVPAKTLNATAPTQKEITQPDAMAQALAPANKNVPAAKVKVDINPVKQPMTEANQYQQALQALQQGNWAQAERLLKSLVDSSEDLKARKSLLSLYKSRGEDASLQLLLQQSLRRYHSDPDFRLLDAGQLFSSARYQSLIDRYQADNDHKAVINLVAAAQQAMGDHAAAIRSYQRSLKLDARQPRNWVSLAIALEQQKQFAQALNAYKSAQRSGALNARLNQFVQQRIEQLSNAG